MAAWWAKRELEESELSGDFEQWLIRIYDGVETLASCFGACKAKNILNRRDFGTVRRNILNSLVSDELSRQQPSNLTHERNGIADGTTSTLSYELAFKRAEIEAKLRSKSTPGPIIILSIGKRGVSSAPTKLKDIGI